MELSKEFLEAKGEITGRHRFGRELKQCSRIISSPFSTQERNFLLPSVTHLPNQVLKNPVEEFLLAWMICPTLWPRGWAALIGSFYQDHLHGRIMSQRM